jgi:Flp pilus assembly protein TadG
VKGWDAMMRVRHKQRQSGIAAVEFVLVLPIFLILTYVAIDFGRLVFQYNTLTKTTRDAAKYIANTVRPSDYATNTTYQNTVTQTRNLVLCGKVSACGSDRLVPNLNTNNVVIDYPTAGGFTTVRVTVQDYSTSFITSIFGQATQNLGAISVTMQQVQQ